MMAAFLLFVAAALALLILILSFRVLAGPTVFDRMLGLNGISTKAIMLLIVIGTIYERLDMFVDIAVGYAILNLLGALAAAKYFEEKGH